MACDTERRLLRFASVDMRREFCYVHSQRIAQDLASGPGYTVCLLVSVCALPISSQGFQTQLECFEQFRHNSRAEEVDNFIK